MFLEEKEEKKNKKKKTFLIIGVVVTSVLFVSIFNSIKNGNVSTGTYRTEEEIKTNPVLEEEKDDFGVVQTEGDVSEIEKAIMNMESAKSFRFTYSINGLYENERNIMDNVIAGKYSEEKGYIKQFTTNNKEQISYNIMKDVNSGETYYKRNEIITKIDNSLALGVTENYEWVSLEKEEISDRNILVTKVDFKTKREMLRELNEDKLFIQELTPQDLTEGVARAYVYQTETEDVIKIREKMLFLNDDQTYIDLYEADEIKLTFKIDANGNMMSEKYEVLIIKTTGEYKFTFEKKYSNLNEEMEFTEVLSSQNAVNREMIRTIKKQSE